jgi:hypothetical protein
MVATGIANLLVVGAAGRRRWEVRRRSAEPGQPRPPGPRP